MGLQGDLPLIIIKSDQMIEKTSFKMVLVYLLVALNIIFLPLLNIQTVENCYEFLDHSNF